MANLIECNQHKYDCHCGIAMCGTFYCRALAEMFYDKPCPFYKTEVQYQLTDVTPERKDRRVKYEK